MKASELIAAVRFALGDTSGVRWSDEHLLEGVRALCRTSQEGAASVDGPLVEAEALIPLVSGVGAMPPGVARALRIARGDTGRFLVRAPASGEIPAGSYRIVGTEIHAPDAPSVLLHYQPRSTDTPASLSDEVPLPDRMRPGLESALALWASGDRVGADAVLSMWVPGIRVHRPAERREATEVSPG